MQRRMHRSSSNGILVSSFTVLFSCSCREVEVRWGAMNQVNGLKGYLMLMWSVDSDYFILYTHHLSAIHGTLAKTEARYGNIGSFPRIISTIGKP